jgi:hypothetical protein
MWRYENFTVLIILSLAPFMWWSAIFLQFSWLWEVVYHWGAINTAVHLYVLFLSSFPTPVPTSTSPYFLLRFAFFESYRFLFFFYYLKTDTNANASFSLPIGLGMFPMVPLTAILQSKMRLKWVILIGFLLMCVFLLLPLSPTRT